MKPCLSCSNNEFLVVLTDVVAEITAYDIDDANLIQYDDISAEISWRYEYAPGGTGLALAQCKRCGHETIWEMSDIFPCTEEDVGILEY